MSILDKKKTLFILFLVIAGCDTSVTETAISHKSTQLDNKHVLIIEKTNEQEVEKGSLSGHVYRVSDIFKYKIEIKPEQAIWSAKGAEPKNILLCDASIYLHFMEKRRNELYDDSQKNTENKTASENKPNIPKYKVDSYYSQFIDKRYFFKWFGDSYWVDISKTKYLSEKKRCAEHPVPNDKEFTKNEHDSKND